MFDLIFKSICLISLLIASSYFTAPIGGLLWGTFCYTVYGTRILGKMLRPLFNDYIKLVLVFKLVGWVISSSGVLMGLIIFKSIFHESLNKWELYITGIVAFGVVLNIATSLTQFDMLTFSEYMPETKKYAGKLFGDNVLEAMDGIKFKKTLSRSLFTNLFITQLFRLFFSIAVLYYSLAHLGVLSYADGIKECSIIDCIKIAFSSIQPLATNSTNLFQGTVWSICNFFASFLIFLWAIFFLSSAQSMFMDEDKIEG